LPDESRLFNLRSHVWQATPNGPGEWGPLRGRGLRQLAAGGNMDGRLEVFAIDDDGVVRHTWQGRPGGAWGDWVPLLP
jgi:hypothetical protein